MTALSKPAALVSSTGAASGDVGCSAWLRITVAASWLARSCARRGKSHATSCRNNAFLTPLPLRCDHVWHRWTDLY